MPRAEAQLIITGTHTIEVDEGEAETIIGPVSGNAQAMLTIVGAGRASLSIASDGFLGTVLIRGAELRLHNGGTMANSSFVVSNGGRLFLDKANDSEVYNYIGNVTTGSITLATGNIEFSSMTTPKQWNSSGPLVNSETVSSLLLVSGSNTIKIQQNAGSIRQVDMVIRESFSHSGTATLDLIGNRDYRTLGDSTDSIAFGYTTDSPDYSISNIVPWATVSGAHWATSVTSGSNRYFIAFSDYQNIWLAPYNIKLIGEATFTADRTINSLRMGGSGPKLNLSGNSLTLISGGLLAVEGVARIGGPGTITTGGGRPLYVHVYGNLLAIRDKAVFTGNTHLIKTGPGELDFNSDAIHEFSEVTINQGLIRLEKGVFSVSGEIVVGDGAGADWLILGTRTTNPVVKTGGGLPSITLHGNPYGSPGEEALLRIREGTRQALAALHIQGRGTLDFTNWAQPGTNILYLDQLTFSDSDARLTIRSWNDQADYLLVRKVWGDANAPAILSRITFEGYGPARWEPHTLQGYGDYWQITPFPEPSTYGAILGAMGLGLWGWRRRVAVVTRRVGKV